MKEKSLNVNQICAFLLAVIPLTKLITAPAVFAGYCNEQLWQPLVILALFDILLIFIFVFTIKKHNNRTFFDILSDSYSPNFAKTVFFYITVLQKKHKFKKLQFFEVLFLSYLRFSF